MKNLLSTIFLMLTLGCSGNILKYNLKNDPIYNKIKNTKLPKNADKSLYFNKKIYFNPIDTNLIDDDFYKQTKIQINTDFNDMWRQIFDKKCKIAKSALTIDTADFIFNIKIISIRTEHPFELLPFNKIPVIYGKRIELWIYAFDKTGKPVLNEQLYWIYNDDRDFIYIADEISILLNSER